MVEKLQRNESGRRLVGTPLFSRNRGWKSVSDRATCAGLPSATSFSGPRRLASWRGCRKPWPSPETSWSGSRNDSSNNWARSTPTSIDAHRLILEDREIPGTRSDPRSGIICTVPSGPSWEATEGVAGRVPHFDRPLLRDRGSDLEEVARRIVANLGESGPPRREEESSEDLILVGSEIGLSDLASFPSEPGQGTGFDARGTDLAYHHHRPGAPYSRPYPAFGRSREPIRTGE